MVVGEERKGGKKKESHWQIHKPLSHMTFKHHLPRRLQSSPRGLNKNQKSIGGDCARLYIANSPICVVKYICY